MQFNEFMTDMILTELEDAVGREKLVNQILGL